MNTLTELWNATCGVGHHYDRVMNEYIRSDEEYIYCESCGQEVCDCGGEWHINHERGVKFCLCFN